MTYHSAAGEAHFVELLERYCRAVQASSFRAGLHPAQWSALRFLAEADPDDRTVTGLAKHQMTPLLSAASKTVNALIRKGYIESRDNPRDRRSRLLELTDAGRRVLDDDPLRRVARFAGSLPEAERAKLDQSLNTLVERIVPIMLDDSDD